MAHRPEPLVVVHAQYRRTRETPDLYRHRDHILSLIVEAHGEYVHGNLPVHIDAPRIVFVPAGTDDINGLQGRVEAWWVGFRWPGFEAELDGPPGRLRIGWDGRDLRCPIYKDLDAGTLLNFVERYKILHAAQQRQDPVGPLRASALFMELFAAYLDLPAGQKTGLAVHRTLTRFHALLEKHACNEESIELLAERAGASADHLRDLFKQHFGQTPVAYRTGLRMNRARELLAGTGLIVSEVARAVGYADPLYFSRAFRKHYGISPREMIRRYRMAGR